MAWDCDGDGTYHLISYTWNHSAAHPTSESCSCYVYDAIEGSPRRARCNITIGTTTYSGIYIDEYSYVEYSPHIYNWKISCDGIAIFANGEEHAKMDLCAEWFADDYYVKTTGDDGDDGLSWANAWATVNKGATTVPDGKTLHIEHGTYNAEPVANKIAPQNAGASGIKYQIHTTGGGTGTATVIVEKN